MYKRVEAFIEENNMLKDKDIVVLGLSGGADSVCLFLMLNKYILDKQADTRLVAVHINHGIRGDEAARDADFCRDMCKEQGTEYRLYNYDVLAYAKGQGLSCEEAGRRLRYEAFHMVEAEYKAAGLNTVIAVAHHKNDQAETVLHNIVRGSALKGAMAIRPVRDGIIRPLLCLGRQEIEAFLKEQGQEYCTDSTNLEDEYIRNRLRNKVIGYLEEEINTGAITNLCRFADKMALVEDYIAERTGQALDKYVKHDESCVFIKDELITEHSVIVAGVIYEVLKSLCGYRDLEEKHVSYVEGLFKLQSGRRINLPKQVVAKRTYEGVFVCKEDKSAKKQDMLQLACVFDEKKKSIQLEWNKIRFELSVKRVEEVYEALGISDIFNKNFPNDLYTKFFDYDKITEYANSLGNISLCLRGRQAGDYITIDKNGHTKKLKQYFIENKIPENERDCIPLFALGNNIIWISGRRGSADFWLDERSRLVLELHMIN